MARLLQCEPGSRKVGPHTRFEPGNDDLLCFLFYRTIAVVALILSLMPAAGQAEAPPKTMRFIPQADLRSIDPIWTTAYITRNFGYMIFDTLFSLDKDFKPQPQMVDHWTIGNGWHQIFTLRDGLKWHDGQPVRAADCSIASLERWGKRDDQR